MSTPKSKDERFERCPRCNNVIRFKVTDTSIKCSSCGAKIKLK